MEKMQVFMHLEGSFSILSTKVAFLVSFGVTKPYCYSAAICLILFLIVFIITLKTTSFMILIAVCVFPSIVLCVFCIVMASYLHTSLSTVSVH